MLRKLIFDFILYSVCFSISLYLHKGTIFPNADYDLYYGAFMISWVISSLLARKYNEPMEEFWLVSKLYKYTESFFLMLGILAFLIYQFDLAGVSRFVIMNSLIISFCIEISFLLYQNKNKISFKHINLIYSSKAFSYELLLYGIIILYLIYRIEGNVSFNSRNLILFLSFYISWFMGSFGGHKFHPVYRKTDYWTFIWQYIKSYLIISALVAFSTFVNRLDIQDVIVIFYGIVTYSILSFIGISLFYHIKKHRRLVLKISGFPVMHETGDVLLNEEIPDVNNHYKSYFDLQVSTSFSDLLKNFTLMRFPKIYEFLKDSIDLNSFNNSYSIIVKSNNISSIDYLPERNLQLLINLCPINNITELNEYLSEVNKKLRKNGIFAGNLETSYLIHQKYLKKYPYYLAQTFYFINCLFNNIIRKLFLLNKIFSTLGGKTNKTLSLAEGMGRMYYCGFEILHMRIIDNRMFFIAKKSKEPLNGLAVSTGLILKMRRLGKDGKMINVYKLRTMYPYSEFLQEFIYKKFNLKEGGKFKNDFRITFWGSILRKLWLDEIPMIYNLIRGDLKLIGFRPLSNHYFNLYTKVLKEKRLKHKPGLIPPFYADSPKTFNEIMESEERYIDAFEKRPIKTDIKYFLRCFNNIFFKGLRSS